MNLLLLTEEDFLADGTVRISGRRYTHAKKVLSAQPNDSFKVGVLNGLVGKGTVVKEEGEALFLNVQLDCPPPARPGVDLILALPRPKALKKILPAVASMGVDNLFLLNSARVEKSYFDSYVLEKASVDELLHLGLEQAKDTVPPKVWLKNRFRPFVEDELDGLFAPSVQRLLPHPPAEVSLRAALKPSTRRVLTIGPEGGWVPFEVELLMSKGFTPVTLGPRPLRVEVAVPYLLGAIGADETPAECRQLSSYPHSS